jgi:hypothetical protein
MTDERELPKVVYGAREGCEERIENVYLHEAKGVVEGAALREGMNDQPAQKTT